VRINFAAILSVPMYLFFEASIIVGRALTK
jgi:hypothetical protein